MEMEKYFLPVQTQQRDKFKEMIIEYVQNITICRDKLFEMMQESKFYGKVRPDFFYMMQTYISMVISLYSLLKPKLAKIEKRTNLEFKNLQYIRKYKDIVFYKKIKMNINTMRVLFDLFSEIADDLFLICEELGYFGSYEQ